MRILHLTSSIFFGGPERQMLGMAEALPADWDVAFLSFGEDGRCAPFLNECRRRGYEAHRLRADTPRLLSARREITRRIQDWNADILLCHTYKADLVGRPAARHAGIPVVAVSRAWTGEDLKVRCYDWLDRRLLNRFDRVVAVSEGQARQVRATGVPEDKLRVIRNSARPDAFRDPDPVIRKQIEALFPTPGERIVLAANRLTPDKGTHVLIEAARQVVVHDPGARFVVCGEGTSRPQLELQVRDSGLADRFVFAGFRNDLDSWMPNADVFVLPSFNEGLPNVVLEASASAVPSVATAVSGTPEILRDGLNGYLVPPGDPNALAERIGRLLVDPGLRRRMGQAGRELTQREFTFASQAQAYVRVCQELAEEHARQLVRS